MVHRVRDYDWASTALGPSAAWPPELRTVVELVLASPMVASVAITDAMLLIYNDHAAALYGLHHPAALGQPLPSAFVDSYAAVAPLYERVFAGESVGVAAQPLHVGSTLATEVFDAYLTPVRTADGTVFAAHMVGLEIGARLRAEAAQESQTRKEFMLKLSDALQPLSDAGEVKREAMRVLTEQLGVTRSEFWEVDPADNEFLVSTGRYSAVASNGVNRVRMADFGSLIRESYDDGRTLIITDAQRDDRLSAEEREAYAGIGLSACVGVPLHRGGRFIAALGVSSREPRAWTGSEIELLVEVAGRALDAIERANAQGALKRSAEALGEREERLRLIVENARDYAIFTMDTEARITDWREGAEEIFGFASGEIIGRNADMLYTPEDNEAGEPEKERALAARVGKAPNVRWHIRNGGDRVFIEGVCTALHDAEGKLTGFLKIGRDATHRQVAEQHQRLLLAQLQHRVRNILAMIRSIVRQSSDAHDDVEEYVNHLVGRLDAMARTQLVLTRSAGAKVNLEDLVRDELQSQVAESGRVVVAGPEVLLSPKAAEVLTLALHELGTNAMKYGALSGSGGRLSVHWRIDARDSSPWLSLVWTEREAQGRAEFSRDGFGSELIRERVPYELRGEARLEFTGDGVVATIAFPMSKRSSVLEKGPAGGKGP